MQQIERSSERPFPKIVSVIFWSLVFVNVISLFGYATFSLHPELLARFSFAPPIFAISYPLFSQLQMALSFALVAAALFHRVKFAWLGLLVATVVISGGAEFSGTSWGIPFGLYEYTGLLGPKFMDKVPYLIPLSWFYMAAPAYALADWTRGEGVKDRVVRIVIGSTLLLAWDLTLDPAMSSLAPYWLWANPGSYYGMPMVNLFGWFVTGLAIMASFEFMRGRKILREVPNSFWLKVYALNLFLPVGMCIAGGFWLAVVLTAGLLAPLAYFGSRISSQVVKLDTTDSLSLPA